MNVVRRSLRVLTPLAAATLLVAAGIAVAKAAPLAADAKPVDDRSARADAPKTDAGKAADARADAGKPSSQADDRKPKQGKSRDGKPKTGRDDGREIEEEEDI